LKKCFCFISAFKFLSDHKEDKETLKITWRSDSELLKSFLVLRNYFRNFQLSFSFIILSLCSFILQEQRTQPLSIYQIKNKSFSLKNIKKGKLNITKKRKKIKTKGKTKDKHKRRNHW